MAPRSLRTRFLMAAQAFFSTGLVRAAGGLLLACALAPSYPLAATAPPTARGPAGLERRVAWKAGCLRLDFQLEAVAHAYGVPVSAVLADPVPIACMPAGRRTGAEALNLIVRECPNYRWSFEDGAVWFTRVGLGRERQNFLNWRLPEVEISGPVGTFLSRLVPLIAAAPRVPSGIVSSMFVPLELSQPLPHRVVRNVTAGAILRAVMEARPVFSSLIIFPKATKLSRADGLAGLSSWQWVPLRVSPSPPPPPLTAHSWPDGRRGG